MSGGWHWLLAGGPQLFPARASPCRLLTELVWASSKHGGLERDSEGMGPGRETSRAVFFL